MNIQDQNFGIEIELTGITRPRAAQIIAQHFGTGRTEHVSDGYDTTKAMDSKGRWWKCSRDVSIRPEIKTNGRIQQRYEGRTATDLRCEVVSPICQDSDIEDVQEIIRKLRAAGAMANDSCGIHVHVDGANHTPDSLVRLMNLTVGRQDIIYEALEIGDRANRWCKKIDKSLCMFGIVVKPVPHDVFHRQAALVGKIVTTQAFHYLADRIWFFHRHKSGAFFVIRRMHTYGHMNMSFFKQSGKRIKFADT